MRLSLCSLEFADHREAFSLLQLLRPPMERHSGLLLFAARLLVSHCFKEHYDLNKVSDVLLWLAEASAENPAFPAFANLLVGRNEPSSARGEAFLGPSLFDRLLRLPEGAQPPLSVLKLACLCCDVSIHVTHACWEFLDSTLRLPQSGTFN